MIMRYRAINALPKTAHPMTQFTTGAMALQVESEFHKAYEKGIHKSKYWEPTYEDSLNLIARVPLVASYVYRRDRALGLPFERPKSVTVKWIEDYCKNAA